MKENNNTKPLQEAPTKSLFKLWTRRIRNLFPTPRAIALGIQFCLSKFHHTISGLKKDFAEAATLAQKAWKTLNAFAVYKIKTPCAKAIDCPIAEKPLIVKVEALAAGKRHCHGGSSYDGIVIDSDGDGHNTTTTGKLDAPERNSTANYFVLYPSRLGLDTKVLRHAMQEEADKKNDYDFYVNNCIDHVIRPLQKAGADIDFGRVSTPQELCIWCDNLCHKQNAGFYLNEAEYLALMKRIDKEKAMGAKNLKFMNALAGLSEESVPVSLEERTADFPDRYPSGVENANLVSLEERTAGYPNHYPSGADKLNTPVTKEVSVAKNKHFIPRRESGNSASL